MTPATLWIVFSVSFLMALSGALMPGPLLTYTIARTMQSRRRGYLVGAWVIAGHALLEGALVSALAVGVAEFLHAPLALKIIGTAGALVLGYMGAGLIRESVRSLRRAAGGTEAGGAAAGQRPETGVRQRSAAGLNPVLAGTLISLANPYWWVWWVTVGSATLIRFDASLANWKVLLAFFLGHEAGDLGWYLAVSTAVHFGRRSLSRRITDRLLVACGVFLIGFGVYLGLSQYLKI
jgi:threonine/homoserine/homoserine lactone efflux protein